MEERLKHRPENVRLLEEKVGKGFMSLALAMISESSFALLKPRACV